MVKIIFRRRGMLLNRFLPRTEFDSYEDFKENYKVNVPENFNFGFDVVDEWAKADRNKKALIWCDDRGDEKVFTFYDIMKMSNKAANFLKGIGIKKGSVVMMIMRRRWEYWVCAVALHKIGAVLIPGSVQLTKKDLVYRAEAADIEAFICVNDEYVLAQASGAAKEAPSVKHLITIDDREGWLNFGKCIENQSDVFERPQGKDATHYNDTMAVFFTSGTTGMPKMVEHNFAHPLGHIVTAKYWQETREDTLHLSVTDSGWAKFGWGKIYGQWLCGAVVFAYDMDKFVPRKLLEKIEHYKINTFCAPPTMYRFMLQENMEEFDLSSVEKWCVAGEPLNPEVFNKWYEHTGKKMCEGFGQTETTVMIANFKWIDPIPGSTGKPSPLYNIELVDENGDPVQDGEEGKIVIKNVRTNPPTGLLKGYYKNHEMTYERLHGDYYDTGDLAVRNKDGYYWFVGRADDVIKCSGYRIGPFEVESVLTEHPSVVECAVTGAPDPIRGQVVRADIVLAKGYEGTEELKKELQSYVKKNTAPYKYPRVIEFVAELPKTIGGKIKRAQIRGEM